MRRTQFALGEVYHIYNRGVDKRSIFADECDFYRFIDCIRYLNQVETITSFEALLGEGVPGDSASYVPPSPPLVRFHTYCMNQNHFHFLLEPLVDEGIQKFMHRLSTSYTMYFNKRHERSGSLFQGSYKSIHVDTNEYFMHLGCYITRNNIVHQKLNEVWLEKLPFSALGEYGGRDESNNIADIKLLLAQYRGKAHFLKQSLSIAKHVAALRARLKLYKKLCID